MGVTIDWDRWEIPLQLDFMSTRLPAKRFVPTRKWPSTKTLWHFAQGINRALLLMATGTGKTFTVFQLDLEDDERQCAQAAACAVPHRPK